VNNNLLVIKRNHKTFFSLVFLASSFTCFMWQWITNTIYSSLFQCACGVWKKNEVKLYMLDLYEN